VRLSYCVRTERHERVGVQLKGVRAGKPVEQEQPRADALPLETGQPAAVAVAVVVPDDFALLVYSGNLSALEVNHLPRFWAEKGEHNGIAGNLDSCITDGDNREHRQHPCHPTEDSHSYEARGSC